MYTTSKQKVIFKKKKSRWAVKTKTEAKVRLGGSVLASSLFFS